MEKIEECFDKAKDVIRKCSTINGLYASAGVKGYNAVWARDSMISMIGASIVNDDKFKEVFRKNIKHRDILDFMVRQDRVETLRIS